MVKGYGGSEMSWQLCLVLFLGWNTLGSIIGIIIASNSCADGWELVNPYWVYQYNRRVNWFGALMLAIGFAALCPVAAAGYWFYKLCTWGRK
jgi:hypothetical protein